MNSVFYINELLPELWKLIVSLLPLRDRLNLRSTNKYVLNITPPPMGNLNKARLLPELWKLIVGWLPLRERLRIRLTSTYLLSSTGLMNIMPPPMENPKKTVRPLLLSFLMGILEPARLHITGFNAGYMAIGRELQRSTWIALVDTQQNVVSVLEPFNELEISELISNVKIMAVRFIGDSLLILRGNDRLGFTKLDVIQQRSQELNLGINLQRVVGFDIICDKIYTIMARSILVNEQSLYFATRGTISCFAFGPSQVLYFGQYYDSFTTIYELDLRTRVPGMPRTKKLVIRVKQRVSTLLYREAEVKVNEHDTILTPYLLIVSQFSWGIVRLDAVTRSFHIQWRSRHLIVGVEEKDQLLLLSAWNEQLHESYIYGFIEWWIPKHYEIAPHIRRNGKIGAIQIVPKGLILLHEGVGIEVISFDV